MQRNGGGSEFNVPVHVSKDFVKSLQDEEDAATAGDDKPSGSAASGSAAVTDAGGYSTRPATAAGPTPQGPMAYVSSPLYPAHGTQ